MVYICICKFLEPLYGAQVPLESHVCHRSLAPDQCENPNGLPRGCGHAEGVEDCRSSARSRFRPGLTEVVYTRSRSPQSPWRSQYTVQRSIDVCLWPSKHVHTVIQRYLPRYKCSWILSFFDRMDRCAPHYDGTVGNEILESSSLIKYNVYILRPAF